MDSAKVGIILEAFVAATLMGMVITLVAIPLGRRFGLATQPRLYGASPTPITYLGGPALILAAFLAFVFSGSWSPQIRVILWAGLAVMMVGFIDDLRTARGGLSPRLRLRAETAIALGMWFGGIQTFSTGPRVLDAVITVVFLVAAMNTINLLDNMDGVSSSTVLASTFGISSVAITSNQYALGTLAAAIGGASLAFLAFNLRRKIYLGDSGSLVLGLLLGACVLELEPGLPPPGSFLVAVVVMAVPFTDTAYRQIRRKVIGGSLFDITGGTDHVSHALVHLGLTTREAAKIHAGTGFLAAAAASFAAARNSLIPLAAALVLFAVLGLGLVAITRKSFSPSSANTEAPDGSTKAQSSLAAPIRPFTDASTASPDAAALYLATESPSASESLSRR